MSRYRSKPVETSYVEALHDEASDSYFVQHVTREGKPKGKIEQINAQEFTRQYEPVVRKPRTNGESAAPPPEPPPPEPPQKHGK